jgi:hypothetical protein
VPDCIAQATRYLDIRFAVQELHFRGIAIVDNDGAAVAGEAQSRDERASDAASAEE